jgi:hypothetical protein
MKLVPTRYRKYIVRQDANLGICHDYEEHLRAAQQGKPVDCFCVTHPYVLRVLDGGRHGQKAERATVPNSS